MSNLFNPFHRIAGVKALVWGEFFTIALSVLFIISDVAQDGFMHFTLLDTAAWKVLLMNHLAWLIFALLLYIGGAAMSRSRVRIIDVVGTIGFSQLLLIPMNAGFYIPAWRASFAESINRIVTGVMPQEVSMLPIVAMGVWSMIWLVLFVAWSYNAFCVSCNVRGTKAVIKFIVAWVIASVAVTQLAKLIYL
ncbi:MAG: hypothetical protein IKA70_04915 [Alistipes sp.]|nr:hypothetical protein [Alistipes sp.]